MSLSQQIRRCPSAISESCLSVVNLVDRLLIDEYWVGHTKAWEIPGTENMKPYINRKDKIQKWLMGTVGFAAIATFLSAIMSLIGFAE